MSSMYTDPCIICHKQVQPYTCIPSVATGAMMYFPNVDRLGHDSRATNLVFCYDCLAKFSALIKRPLELTYNPQKDMCQCRSLMDDPAIESRTGNGIETYIAIAVAISRQFDETFAPLDHEDFRRFLQIKLTSDWTGTQMYDFVSDHVRSWLKVDFYEIADILWNLYTFKKPMDVARCIVRRSEVTQFWPTYERIKSEKSICEHFYAIISTDPYDSNFGAYRMSEKYRTDYPDIIEDFEIDIDTARRFFKASGQLVNGTYYLNQIPSMMGGLLVRSAVDVSFGGNIGMKRVRGDGRLQYET